MAGVERATGVSLDDVNVHYNSGEPRKYGALAFTRGTDVHLAPGQERHLGHELGHVVQQKRGSVPVTMRVGGVGVNDNPALESEADRIGAGNGVVQRFVERNGWRVSDDNTIKIVNAPNPIKHHFCIKKDKLNVAQFNLSLSKRQVKLVEANNCNETDWQSVTSKYNGMSGDRMTATPDCGQFAQLITGANPKAKIATTMVSGQAYDNIARRSDFKDRLMEYIKKNLYNFDNTVIDDMITADHYESTKSELNKRIDFKKNLSDRTRYEEFENMIYHSDKLSKKLKINKYADPQIGEGFVTISGGRPIGHLAAPPQGTWNYHWSGVVAESKNKKDKMIAENYADGTANLNNHWTFQMHGQAHSNGAEISGGTFHETHYGSYQHGDAPLTMTVSNRIQ
jgi:hypothetical protein